MIKINIIYRLHFNNNLVIGKILNIYILQLVILY